MARASVAQTLLSALAVVSVVVGGTDALARAGGHPGATGRDNAGGRCNRCHSPDTFDGAEVVLDDQYRHDCYVKENGQWTLDQSFYAIPYGAQVPVHLYAPLPPEGAPDNPGTPANDRVVGLYCPDGSTCASTVAGFAIEVEGAQIPTNGTPALVADAADNQEQAQTEGANGPESSAIEVNHSAPKAYANNEVRWTMLFNAPIAYEGINPPNQVRFWAGVNVCNGNGAADLGDITSYTNRYVYFELADGTTTAPDLGCTVADQCAPTQTLDLTTLDCTCAEGQDFVDGECVDVGCGCATADAGTRPGAVFAVLALVGLAAVRRRRD